MSPDRILSFGEFRLDPISGHLYRQDEPVALAPKAFALLQCLANQAGRLVSKPDLLAAVWPGLGVPFVDRGTRQLGGEARPLGVLAVSTEPHPD